MGNNLENQIEEIRIPETVKNLPVACFDFSVRLENVLRGLKVEILGDLREMSFNEVGQTLNCGRKTVDELREFVARLQDEKSLEMLGEEYRQQLENIEKNDVRNELIEKIETSSEHQPSKFIKF